MPCVLADPRRSVEEGFGATTWKPVESKKKSVNDGILLTGLCFEVGNGGKQKLLFDFDLSSTGPCI